MYSLVMGLTITLFASTGAAPGVVSASGSAEIGGTKRPPIISFENGTIAVNFLGFKASAGLGGLLTGNMADGGPHAEAGTPFGQSAGAGLGANVDENGESRGYRYHYSNNRFSRFRGVPNSGAPSAGGQNNTSDADINP